MKILVISDIHANLPALEAVLKAAGDIDAAWCLGDLVGYGPDPNECISIVRSLPNLICLLGNHDAAALGQIGIESFNLDASLSALWTKKNLSADSYRYLQSLPQKQTASDKVELAHGSPRNPVWEYILDIYTARDNLDYFDTQLCLVGHTHLSLGYILSEDESHITLIQFQDRDNMNLESRAILNPGSVGQPRDHDPRAGFALYYPDDNIWEAFRIKYDIKSVQKRIMDAGLPSSHAKRLSQGW
jgi:diadenosine tetraphosphatase ApaH/serine/threonine PP2A family protein phosphatase